MRATGLIAAGLLLGCASAPAQSNLADRILGVKDGTVRLAYAVREGICGDGETFIRDRSRGENNVSFDEGNSRYYSRGWRERPCEPGPARVAFLKSGGMITRVRLYVGGSWGSGGDDVVDLGEVAGPVAAKAMLAVAAKERRADRAIFAAVIADSAVVWPDLLAIAKNDVLYKDTRKSAVFWLSQAAGDAATKGLSELAEDDSEARDIRDQAVFALSQLPSDQGVPVLIRLAKSNKDPQVRRKALFWLGQSDDPRVLRLFEEILTGRS
jgi:HEAT repeat protein